MNYSFQITTWNFTKIEFHCGCLPENLPKIFRTCFLWNGKKGINFELTFLIFASGLQLKKTLWTTASAMFLSTKFIYYSLGKKEHIPSSTPSQPVKNEQNTFKNKWKDFTSSNILIQYQIFVFKIFCRRKNVFPK